MIKDDKSSFSLMQKNYANFTVNGSMVIFTIGYLR